MLTVTDKKLPNFSFLTTISKDHMKHMQIYAKQNQDILQSLKHYENIAEGSGIYNLLNPKKPSESVKEVSARERECADYVEAGCTVTRSEQFSIMREAIRQLGSDPDDLVLGRKYLTKKVIFNRCHEISGGAWGFGEIKKTTDILSSNAEDIYKKAKDNGYIKLRPNNK